MVSFLVFPSLSNSTPILYPESFMLSKTAIYNDLWLELETFDSNKEHNQCLCLFKILTYQELAEKQMCFETHHYL